MADFPYMSWYPRDFIADTRGLKLIERGAYRELLDFMWLSKDCTLPSDLGQLARLLGVSAKQMDSIWQAISPFFQEVSGCKITQKRIKKEHEKARTKSKHRAIAGSKGGVAKALRAKEMQVANASDLPQQKSSIPEPYKRETPTSRSSLNTNQLSLDANSPSPNGDARAHRAQYDSEFDTFWAGWPSKQAKKPAKEAFVKARKEGASFDAIIQGEKRYVANKPYDRQWMNPTTFLNQARFNDEWPGKTNGPGRGHGPPKRDVRDSMDDLMNVGQEDPK